MVVLVPILLELDFITMSNIMNKDLTLETMKTLPPVTISGMILWDVSLNEWVLILTAVWLIVQIGFTIYDRIKKKRNE